MSEEEDKISTELLASLCVMLLACIVTVFLHKKLKILLQYHQIAITIILGAGAGFILLVTASFKVE